MQFGLAKKGQQINQMELFLCMVSIRILKCHLQSYIDRDHDQLKNLNKDIIQLIQLNLIQTNKLNSLTLSIRLRKVVNRMQFNFIFY